MDFQLPQIIAHRGAPKLAPENTLASLHAAKRAGASFVEFDTMLSADNVSIVFHDKTLDRTTSGNGQVKTMSYEQLRQLDAGSWFNEKFHLEKIPSLEEFIITAANLKIGINIELKAAKGSEEILANSVLTLLKKHWTTSLPTPLLSSFSVTNLQALRSQHCPFPLGLNLEHWESKSILTATKLGCSSIHVHHSQATRKIIETNTEHGFKTLAYTVNDKIMAQTLFSMGLNAIFSDIPDLIQG